MFHCHPRSFALFAAILIMLVTSPLVMADKPSANSGKVLEAIDAQGYTYMHLETATGNRWVAIPKTEVETGKTISYVDGIVMENFESKTLGKTFETIIFSAGLAGAEKKPFHGGSMKKKPQKSSSSFSSAVANEQKSGMQQKESVQGASSSSGSTGAIVPMIETSIAKAEGSNSYTIEEIFQKADELNSMKVVVRGKVVKFSPNIMGKNWIHLQDGTGNPMNNSHDLVVTTEQQIEVDTVVTVEGILAAKKDFGFGYKYEAIIEEAKLK